MSSSVTLPHIGSDDSLRITCSYILCPCYIINLHCISDIFSVYMLYARIPYTYHFPKICMQHACMHEGLFGYKRDDVVS